ncbi:MAG: Gfo/Idh/MocA family oxidoreductase [Dehalococcoidia bacterium]|nr:Gfo/Idh/MocA family oxidoreductase [Dehalococcoidia bacterium]
MPPVKLAIIGLGLMGNRHIEIVNSFDGCDLVAVCDLNPDLRALADRHKIPFFQDIGEMLDSTRPNGAILATQSAAHIETFEACARRGVHALIEKPVADTTQAALHIAELADLTNTRVLVGHHRRHNPLVKAAHDVVTSGQIGNLLAVSMMWTLMKPDGYFDIGWRSVRPDGGPVLINLVHELDILRYICGEIDQVFAQGRSKARGFEVEDSVSISITFRSGTIATILGSDAVTAPWSYEATTGENPLYFNVPENCYYFTGTEGALAFPQMELWSYPDRDRRGWQHPMEKSVVPVSRADSLTVQLAHFCDVVRGTRPPLVDARDGARSLAAALAVLESISTNKPITPSIDPA